MARPFVSEFLLPLVAGGKLWVGRPIGPAELEILEQRWNDPRPVRLPGRPPSPEDDAAEELARRRALRARALLPLGRRLPALDAPTLRLGAAVHNILCLSHPGLIGRKVERTRQNITEATLPFLELGPPRTALEAVERHSLLGRLGEVVQVEHVVHTWLGERRYVGRTPPPQMLAFEGLRRVRHDRTERIWSREIGVPAGARRLWVALAAANPLAEALDPLRLDPPVSWDRLLTVLQFPPLCRVVAGRVLELGAWTAGEALAGALFRHVSQTRAPEAMGAEARFALQFLAHVVWLEGIFGAPQLEPLSFDLAALLGAAAETLPDVVFPPDLRASPAGAAFATRLAALAAETRIRAPERWGAALEVCRCAATPAPQPLVAWDGSTA
jgi:hypothetical protein